MKVAVVGAAGMLGAVTVREWREHGHAVTPLMRADLDVTNYRDVRAGISRISPDVVINCTAYNNVDAAEDDPSIALAVNTWAVRSMARAAAEAGAVFVHYSTDFVFDGVTDRPYIEHDAPNPQSAYGMSKLMGEWFALEARGHSSPHYVLRVESLFGGSASRSTIDRMLDTMRTGGVVRAFSDRVVSPSHVDDVARATRELVKRQATGGLYHCVNSGSATWLSVAKAVSAALGIDAQIEGVSTTQIPLKARRPNFAALSNEKLTALGIEMPPWTVAVQRHLA